MAEKSTTEKLHRDAFYKDALRFTILVYLDKLPHKFTITELVEYMNGLAEKPFAEDELPAFAGRCKRAMRTWKKAGKLTISSQITDKNNTLTNYTQKTPKND